MLSWRQKVPACGPAVPPESRLRGCSEVNATQRQQSSIGTRPVQQSYVMMKELKKYNERGTQHRTHDAMLTHYFRGSFHHIAPNSISFWTGPIRDQRCDCLCVEGCGAEPGDKGADWSKCELETCGRSLLYSVNDLCAALPPSQCEAAAG